MKRKKLLKKHLLYNSIFENVVLDGCETTHINKYYGTTSPSRGKGFLAKDQLANLECRGSQAGE